MSGLVLDVDVQLAAAAEKHAGFALREAALLRVLRATTKMLTDHGNALLRKHGLTMTEYYALAMLDVAPEPVSVSDLIRFTGEKASNMTRVCDQLLGKGLMSRFPSLEDRRVLMMEITPQGRDLMAQLVPLISVQLRELFAPLDEAEGAVIEKLLKRLLAQ